MALDHEILAEALRHGRGRIDTEELKGAMAAQEINGALLREGVEVATVESLEREREMIGFVNRGIGAFEPVGGGGEFIASDTLNPQQKRAVEFVLNSRDRVVAISGAAGTGKTATLRELRRGLRESGRQVVALAPTMSAVAELQAVGFSEACTIERMLRDQQCRTALANAVIILDEAGMVSGRQMSDLLRLAEEESFPNRFQRGHAADSERRSRRCIAHPGDGIALEERYPPGGATTDGSCLSNGN